MATPIDAPHEQAVDAARWVRLERYARWKQRRFRLLHLPDELLGLVASHLDEDDVLRLATACVGHSPRVEVDADAVPVGMRSAWITHTVVGVFRGFLQTRLSGASVYLRGQTGMNTVVLIDWSPFSDEPPRPVARLGFADGAPRVQLCMDEFTRLVTRRMRDGLPVVRVTAHLASQGWDGDGPLGCGTYLTFQTPWDVTNHTLFPHCLLPRPPPPVMPPVLVRAKRRRRPVSPARKRSRRPAASPHRSRRAARAFHAVRCGICPASSFGGP